MRISSVAFAVIVAVSTLVGAARAEAPVATPAQSDEIQVGAGIFYKNCGLCHDDSAHMLNDNGPALFGVVGRKVGSVEGFDYSPALLKANAQGHIWSEKRLDRFLSNPQHMYTGTNMPMMFNDPKVRHALIAYLKSSKSPD
ncbi:MAG: hypothetical protein JF615_05835 [Asticcacaulis sp.]|nr:hypothetical protein [Asticcacaulis sp.]